MSLGISIASELVVAQFQRDFLDNLRSVRGVDVDAATWEVIEAPQAANRPVHTKSSVSRLFQERSTPRRPVRGIAAPRRRVAP